MFSYKCDENCIDLIFVNDYHAYFFQNHVGYFWSVIEIEHLTEEVTQNGSKLGVTMESVPKNFYKRSPSSGSDNNKFRETKYEYLFAPLEYSMKYSSNQSFYQKELISDNLLKIDIIYKLEKA